MKLLSFPTGYLKFSQVLLLLLSLASVFADDGSSSSLNAGSIVGGIILVVIGLIFTFAGNRILKFIIFFSGALLFAYLTFCSASAIIDWHQASDGQKTGVYIAMGILGLVGGMLAACVWQIGLLILGGCMGGSLGSMLARTNIVSTHTGQIIMIIVFVVVFAVLTFMFSKIFVTVSTAVFGAFTFMVGVDFFVQAGFDTFLSSVKRSGETAPLSGAIWAMLVSVILIALIGILVQFKSR